MTTKSKYVLFAILAILVAPVAALAGINPASSGLPNVTLATGDNNYYNISQTVPGNRASVMCVACHTRNPGARTAYRTTNGYGYVGSHFVTSTFADTSEGGGYADGSGTKTRANRIVGGIYMADNTPANMTIANRWYGAPRYAYDNGGALANTVDPQTTAAQMICDSCHSILRNLGPAKLLATGFANGGAAATAAGSTVLYGVPAGTVPDLCIGCHGNMEAYINAEWQYHPVGGTPWGGTHHHRNNPGTAVYLGNAAGTSATSMIEMNPADYNEGNPLTQMWAAGPGGLTSARPMDWASNPGRVKPIFTDNGMIAPRAAANGVLCTNCHRAHNADSSAGATILMRSTDTTAMRSGTIATDNTSAWRGLTRIADAGGRAGAFANTNPLCLACHR